MLKTIIVALDSSEFSQQTIKSLDWLQIQPTTKIILCHVIPTGESEEEIAVDRPHNVEDLLYQEIERQLQSFQKDLPCKSEIEIVNGEPAVEIIRLAYIHQADLIAIGSRGLTGVNRIIKGSVSSQVATDAPCCVMVVKPAF